MSSGTPTGWGPWAHAPCAVRVEMTTYGFWKKIKSLSSDGSMNLSLPLQCKAMSRDGPQPASSNPARHAVRGQTHLSPRPRHTS